VRNRTLTTVTTVIITRLKEAAPTVVAALDKEAVEAEAVVVVIIITVRLH
jgi:hypothetical protein